MRVILVEFLLTFFQLYSSVVIHKILISYEWKTMEKMEMMGAQWKNTNFMLHCIKIISK